MAGGQVPFRAAASEQVGHRQTHHQDAGEYQGEGRPEPYLPRFARSFNLPKRLAAFNTKLGLSYDLYTTFRTVSHNNHLTIAPVHACATYPQPSAGDHGPGSAPPLQPLVV